MAGPYEVTMGYAARARDRGIQFCEETLVTGIQRKGDRVVGVETNQRHDRRSDRGERGRAGRRDVGRWPGST